MRLYHLGHFSFWLDETVQYEWSIAPFSDILFQLQPDQMLLTTVLSHLQIQAHVGESIWQLRLPSAIFGTGSASAIAMLARELSGRTAGLVAGLLAAGWPVLIVYSQEYRPYALEILLASLLLLFLAKAHRTQDPSWWVLLSVTAVLYLYNHMTSVIGVAAVWATLLLWTLFDIAYNHIHQNIRVYFVREFRWIFISIVIVVCAYLPGTMMMARFLEYTRSNANIVSGSASLPLNRATFSTIFGSYIGLGNGGALIVTGCLGVIGLVVSLLNRKYILCSMLVCWIAIPLYVYAHSFGGSMSLFSDRYFLVLVPAYIVLIAQGILYLGKIFSIAPLEKRIAETLERATIVSVVTIVLCLATVQMSLKYQSDPKQLPMDLSSAYRYVLDRVSSGDVIVQASVDYGQTIWFDHYNSYFLRGRDLPPGASVFRLASDAKRPGVLCLAMTLPRSAERCADRRQPGFGLKLASLAVQAEGGATAQGHAWALLTTTEAGARRLRATLDGRVEVRCYEGICAVGAGGRAGTDGASELATYVEELAAVVS